MGRVTPISDVLTGSLMSISNSMHKKILLYEIAKRWNEIAGDLSEKIFPVKFKDSVLTLQSNDNAVKDNAKFLVGEFIRRINKQIGDGKQIVTKIEFGNIFQQAQKNFRADVATEIKTYDISKVKLTAREIAACEKMVAAVENPATRQIMLETFINRAKYDKLKRRDGWHKCQLCDVLCPPSENLCGYCRVTEREKMQIAIKNIFIAEPSTTFRDIQKKMLTDFPHLTDECSLEFIEAVRMELILRKAALLSYGDTNSDKARALVMLIRQLPEEKLTDAVINRTLKEFRFNLADLPPFEKRNFVKPMSKLKKINRHV